MLIRSSLLWLTRDQVFLFDVQRSTSGYCMREYKHGYCSGQSNSASSSVYTEPFNRTCLSSIRACVQGFAHARTPRVLHFSAFIFIFLHIIYSCIFPLYINQQVNAQKGFFLYTVNKCMENRSKSHIIVKYEIK